MLGCLSMGLLGFLRNEQTQQLCQLMKSLESAGDYVLLIHQLLRGAFSLLLRATNIRTGCRLALLNQDLTKALIFEPDRKQPTTPEMEMAAARAPTLSVTQDAQIHVTEIQLENTLLLDAVQKGKARFVSDCASYIQSCMKPATDIFISGQEMVASIVVLPLIYEGHTFGGFYGERVQPIGCMCLHWVLTCCGMLTGQGGHTAFKQVQFQYGVVYDLLSRTACHAFMCKPTSAPWHALRARCTFASLGCCLQSPWRQHPTSRTSRTCSWAL